MKPINAIAKVRFSSARPQRVHLVEDEPNAAALLCLESEQKISVSAPAVLYVVTGLATVTVDGGQVELATGHLVVLDDDCVVANAGEQRLVCLSFKGG